MTTFQKTDYKKVKKIIDLPNERFENGRFLCIDETRVLFSWSLEVFVNKVNFIKLFKLCFLAENVHFTKKKEKKYEIVTVNLFN